MLKAKCLLAYCIISYTNTYRYCGRRTDLTTLKFYDNHCHSFQSNTLALYIEINCSYLFAPLVPSHFLVKIEIIFHQFLCLIYYSNLVLVLVFNFNYIYSSCHCIGKGTL